MLCVSGSQLMKHPTLKHSHTPLSHEMAQQYLFEAESDSNKIWGEGVYGVQIGNSHCAHLIEEKESRGLFCPLEPKHHVCNRTGKIIQFWCFISKK